MGRGVSQKTKKLTLGAVLCALGVVLLSAGSLIETIDLSAAAFASFICIFAVIELGGIYPWIIYLVTGVLALIFTPFGMAGWFYIAFFGYYPILKEKVERLGRPIAWTLKILILNIALVICVIISYLLFFRGTGDILGAFAGMFGEEKMTELFVAGMWLLVNAAFVLYDIASTLMISTYIRKLRHKFKFLH